MCVSGGILSPRGTPNNCDYAPPSIGIVGWSSRLLAGSPVHGSNPRERRVGSMEWLFKQGWPQVAPFIVLFVECDGSPLHDWNKPNTSLHPKVLAYKE